MGGVCIVDTGRSAGEDDSLGGIFPDPGEGNIVGMDLAIDALLPDTAGNQLRHLGAEIENQNLFAVNIFGHN
jgi:hypothetical protein